MQNYSLGINAAGNPAVFDKSFLAMLKKSKTTVDPSKDPPPPPGPSAGTSSSASTDEPTPFLAELLGLTGSRSGSSFISTMRNAFEAQSPDIAEIWRKQGEILIDEEIENTSHTVQQRRGRIDKLFRTYVHQQEPDLDPAEFWREDIFDKHWHGFLVALLTCSRGRDGGPVRVNTFQQWCGDLIWLVGRNLVDKDNVRIGTKRLTSGLYAKFKKVCDTLTVQFDLNRIPAPRFWIGALELLMIYQVGIRLSEKYGRASVLQTILCTNISFHTGARVGSLGHSHPKNLKEGKYMKCGDVRIKRVNKGVWDAQIRIVNRKGANSSADSARPLEYTISAVTKTHNLWFDTPSLLLLFLMSRGALKGINSIEAIFDYDGEYFEIVDSMRDEPLLVERTQRGLGLGKGAASAGGLTASFGALGKQAGFPSAVSHSIRRDAANVFTLVFGAQTAQLALGHAEGDSTLHNFYAKTTRDLPLSEARLGLLTHKLPLAQRMALQRHHLEGQAAYALLKTGFQFYDPTAEPASTNDKGDGEDNDPTEPPAPAFAVPTVKRGSLGVPKFKLTPEQQDSIEKNGIVVQKTRDLEDHWRELYSLFPTQAINTHGSKKVAILDSMRDRYKDDPLCVRNTERIDELMELIPQLQKSRDGTVGTLTKEFKNKAEAEWRSAEMKNRTVYLADDVKRARKKVEEMGKVLYLPRPSEQLKRLETIRDMPNCGGGLLSEACQKYLNNDENLGYLQNLEADEDEEPGDEIPDGKSRKEGATETIDAFDDLHEVAVFDADLVKTKKIRLNLVYEPIQVEKYYEQLAEENDGKIPCVLCRSLPAHLKPKTTIMGNEGAELFKSRAKLEQHEKAVHTDWVDLVHHMLTDNPEEFKCPLKQCEFRASDVLLVRDHCLDECTERELYREMLAKHEERQEIKRVERETEAKKSLKERKDILALEGSGLKLPEHIVEGAQKISVASPEEVLQLAEERADHVPQSDILADLHGLAALNVRARTSMDEDGIVQDPYASTPMEHVYREIVTPDIMADIETRMERKK